MISRHFVFGATALVLTAGLGSPVAASEGGPDGTASFFPVEDPAACASWLDRELWTRANPAPEVQPPVFPLDVVQSSLPAIGALVGFVPEGDRTYCVVIRRDRVSARILETPQLPIMAGRLQDWAQDPAQTPYDPRAALLVHNNLFPPLREELGGVKWLIVAAAGDLAALPFDVLLTMLPEDVSAPNYADLAYLAKRYVCSYEMTLGSRVGWSQRNGGFRRLDSLELLAEDPLVPGALILYGEPRPADRSGFLRGLQREGARGVLLTTPAVAEPLRQALVAASDKPWPTTLLLQRLRLERLRTGAPPETWAFPLLWGGH